MKIIDGRKISQEILINIQKEVDRLDFTPVFCDVLVGEDLASKKYVELKKRKALELGLEFYDANFPRSINTEDLIKEIIKINNVPNMCGVIVQLPLPLHIDREKVLNSILPTLDVDCLGGELSDKFYGGDLFLAPPTALACMYLLESLEIDLKEKNILIIGEGKLVGRPFANILKYKGLNFNIINSQSENTEALIKNADVIITGVGKGKLITENMIKADVIIIDAGTSEEDSILVGDVDFENVKEKVSFITPVPGGVGPVTVAMLFQNILKVAERKQNE